MKHHKLSSLFTIAGLVFALTPVLETYAQSNTQYYNSVANSCQAVLNSNGRSALWSDIRASAVNDTGSTSSDNYYKRVTEHCEWNLRGEKPLWRSIINKAIASLPITNQPYYQQRIAAHCESLLNKTNRADWWRLIRDSAINDANNTTSDFYYKRVGEHCSYLLNQRKQPEAWNLIEQSARLDTFNKK